MTTSTKTILDGIVTFSNEFPISLLVSEPVPFVNIKDLQSRYSKALGYPVVIMEGFAVDDGYKMSFFHRDSVLSTNVHYSQLRFSCSSLTVVGLWDGDSVTDLARLIFESHKTKGLPAPYRYMALNSRKLSESDLSPVSIGIKESMNISYFRDKYDCGLVLDKPFGYWDRKLILSPNIELLRLSMLIGSQSRHKISNMVEVEGEVKTVCIEIAFDSELTELDKKIGEFNNAISVD